MADPSVLNHAVPLSFVECVSNGHVRRDSLLWSPCVQPSSPHKVILVKNGPGAADVLNLGLELAQNEWVACVHRHACLPKAEIDATRSNSARPGREQRLMPGLAKGGIGTPRG